MQCKNCGQDMYEDDNFCHSCGYKVVSSGKVANKKKKDDSFQENNYKHNKIKIKTNKIVFILIAVFLVIITVFGISTKGAASLRAIYNVKLGSKYTQEGRPEEAILAFKRAINIDEKNVDARLKLAQIFISMGQNDSAESILKETIALDNTNQTTYVILAGIYEKEKRSIDLLELLSKGMSFCKEKNNIRKQFEKVVSGINISDIKASAVVSEKYTLPQIVQVQMGEDKFELPVLWKTENVDTSKVGSEKVEGTIQLINRPIVLNLNVEMKSPLVTDKKTTKDYESYSIDFNVPVVSIEGENSDHAAALNSMIEKDFNKFQADIAQAEEDSKNYYNTVGKYQFNVGYKVEYNKSGLISIVMTFYSQTGGVHGMAYKIAYNYDLIHGKVLEFQDVFSKDIDAYNLVKDEVVKQMLVDNYFDEGINGVKNRTKPFNFYISDQGVVIFFGEYEVAPYSSGMPEFTITKNTIFK